MSHRLNNERQTRLSIRIDTANLNHHLWNNHGTWWMHYTIHIGDLRVRRIRRSLDTSDVKLARVLRNMILATMGARFE